MAAPGDPVALARRIYDRTGSRDQTISGMVNMGYPKREAVDAVNQVAPEPAKATPSPAAAKPAGDDGPKGAPLAPQSPDPTAAPSSPALADLPRPTLSLPRRPTSADVAGFGFGLVAYTLFLQFLRYGPGGPTGWFLAKFLNRPYAPAAGAVAEPDSSTSPTGTTADPAADLTTTRPTVAAPPDGALA